MDLNLNIPSFAMLRHGTVIVRLKMEVIESWTESFCIFPAKGFRRVVQRLSGCEQCHRTRYSDCDRGKVNKTTSRTYRASAARSRYVNVCAAVCLLLVFCTGIAPRAAAAPFRTMSDHRTKRSEDGENHKPKEKPWENPCDLDESSMQPQISYTSELADQTAKQASSALHSAEAFEDIVVKEHSYDNYAELSNSWNSTEFLGKLKTKPWCHQSAIPDKLNFPTNKTKDDDPTDEQHLNEIMGEIDEVLPSMYKVLQVLIASIFHISEKWRDYSAIPDHTLNDKLLQTGHNVKGVLCHFYAVMRARNLQVTPLPDAELLNIGNIHRDMFLVYRDTRIYLEYINQVFEKMANNTELDKNA